MHACDWSKSSHVTYTKSQYCPHETLVPSWIFMYVNSSLINYSCQFDFSFFLYVNFHHVLCIGLKLFSLSLVPLLATEAMGNTMLYKINDFLISIIYPALCCLYAGVALVVQASSSPGSESVRLAAFDRRRAALWCWAPRLRCYVVCLRRTWHHQIVYSLLYARLSPRAIRHTSQEAGGLQPLSPWFGHNHYFSGKS